MLTITSNEQANSLVKYGVLYVDGNIEIAFDGFRIEASINCKNIYSKGEPRAIYARKINAKDIEALDIEAFDIDARDINAGDIYARYIKARELDTRDIKARDINALDINARNIKAESCTYSRLTCNSIEKRS